jgi:hypothetical protein
MDGAGLPYTSGTIGRQAEQGAQRLPEPGSNADESPSGAGTGVARLAEEEGGSVAI